MTPRDQPPVVDTLNGRRLRAWAGTVTTNLLNVVCGLATAALAARLLGPEGRGALAILTLWPQVVAGLGLLSLPSAVAYLRAKSTGPEEARALAVTALWFGVGLAAVVMLIGLALMPLLIREPELVRLASLYLILLLPPHFVALTLLGLDQGRQAFSRYNGLRLVPQSVYLAALIALMILHLATLETVLLAMWIGVAMTATARLWLAKGELFQRPRLKPFLMLLAVGGRFHGAAVLALVVAQIDRLFVILLFDTTSVGYYVAAVAYATTGFHVLNGAFGTLLFPEIASQTGAVGQRHALVRTLRQASVVSIAISIPLALLAPWLLALLFGTAFAPAVPLAQALVGVAALQALREVIAVGCAGIQMWRPPIFAEASTLVVMTALALPAASTFGPMGIVVAAGASNAVGLGYLLVIAVSRFDLRPGEWWGLTPVRAITIARRGWSALSRS